jgi:hypothetical protein
MMTVGDIDGKPSINDADFPANSKDGQLYVGRSVILNPINGLPDPSDSHKGEMVYNSADETVYIFNGTWAPLAPKSAAGEIKYVRSHTLSIDCGEGWMITKCGFGDMPGYMMIAQAIDGAEHQAVGGMFGSSCGFNCFGNQTCTTPPGGAYRASIAECVKKPSSTS